MPTPGATCVLKNEFHSAMAQWASDEPSDYFFEGLFTRNSDMLKMLN